MVRYNGTLDDQTRIGNHEILFTTFYVREKY